MEQDKNPLISVIIPTYNMAEYVGEAIDSVLSQTYKNIEIIIVDDGSKDNTREILKRYNSCIKYIYQENKGLSAARNTGIRVSKGAFLAFLDADDMWLPEKLECQIRLISIYNTVGIVGCSDYIINEETKIIELFQRNNDPCKKGLLKTLFMRNMVSGGSEALVRRECFEKVGLFDERLKSAEDWDMWLRISTFYEIKFAKEYLTKIRVRSDSMCSPSNVATMLENELFVVDKFFTSKNGLNLLDSLLKRKIYSYRYFRAANSCKLAENDRDAKKYLIKSFCLYPFNFWDNSYPLLVLYCLLGNKRFKYLKEYYKNVFN